MLFRSPNYNSNRSGKFFASLLVVAVALLLVPPLFFGEKLFGQQESSAKNKPAADSTSPPSRLGSNPKPKPKPKGKKGGARGKGKKGKKGSPAKNAQRAVRRALPKEMAELFPIGRVFKGVIVPSYEGDDVDSVMNSAIVKRIDKNHLDLTKLKIDFYNSEGNPDTTIRMERAEYHLGTGVLTSKTPAKIEQEEFTMRGDRMTFDTETQVSRLVGNVRVIIPDASGLTPGSKKKSTAPETPAAPQ